MLSVSQYLVFILASPLVLGAPTSSFSALTKAVSAATASSSFATTENNQTCGALNVIFARGTTEPGNVGILAGPPFFDALQKAVGGNVAVQGVDYPASIPGFLAGGSDQGAATMASLVKTSLSQCPNSKVVMAGYSQGGQLVHKAATDLGAAMSSVNSVVIFGDPLDGTAVSGIDASKVSVICHEGDDICLHGDLVLEPHLTYSENANQAATFVAGQSGLGIASNKRKTI